MMPLLGLLSALTLLQTSKPIAAQDWQNELERIAGEVAESLSRPQAYRFHNEPDSGKFIRDLELAAVWPHPKFREPLLKILESENSFFVVNAAEALINYNDPQLRAIVEKLKNDGRISRTGCLVGSVGNTITSLLKEGPPPRQEFAPVETLVSMESEESGFLDYNFIATTVPRAVEALRHDNLSVRIQAFFWLARHGLVLDVKPLLEAWPRLSNPARAGLLWCFDSVRWGQNRLQPALEQFLKDRAQTRLSDMALGRLLVRLGDLQSPLVRETALDIIQKRIDKAAQIEKESADTPDDDLLTYAFGAFGTVAQLEDIERALGWSRAEVRLVRLAGLCVLARFDDPRARDAVSVFIENDLPARSPALFYGLDPLVRLQERSWKNDQYKWHYLRLLATVLSGWLKKHEGDFLVHDFDANCAIVELIQTLEAIAHTSNGETGMRMTATIDRETAQNTADQWAKWIKQNDPHKK